MRKLALWLCALSMVCGSTVAQQFPLGQSLAAQMRWLQLSVVGGRIVLLSDQINVADSHTRHRDREERLHVGFADGMPSINYRLTSKDQEITATITERRRVEIVRRSRGAASQVTIEFLQQPHGDLTLKVTRDGSVEQWSAPTLWHLWLSHRAACREHLEPLLRLLRPEWHLDDDSELLAREIVGAAHAEESVDRQRWVEWVAQLGSPDFATRQSADRQIREAGQTILPFLTRLDRRQLDAEQWFRVRRILQRLEEDQREDSPDRAVNWLRSDPRIWLVMAERDDLPTREAAARQLGLLLGPQAVFDPTAAEPQRREQLARIAETLRASGEPAVATEPTVE